MTLRIALIFGLVLFAAAPLSAQVVEGIDFGDDSSMWANDGECDDPRFVGPGMTDTQLLESDRGHDATDCIEAYRAGRIQLRESTPDSKKH